VNVHSKLLAGLSVLNELSDREADVLSDLAEQNRRDVSTLVKWHCSGSARAVSILLVRTTLSDLREAELEQYRDDLRRLENGYLTHLCNCDAVDANKFGLKLWFTVLEEHGDYLLEVLVQFV